jgi:hypothetical protein
MNMSRRVDQSLAAAGAFVPRSGSFDAVERQPGAAPSDEATCDLSSTVAQRRLRTHGVLAEVDRPLAGLEDVASQRCGNRPRRGAVDDDTALKVTDGTVEVISEGHWKLLTHTLEASERR